MISQFNSIRCIFNDVQINFFKVVQPRITDAFLILGGSGLGKTTLYHAINELQKLKIVQEDGECVILNSDDDKAVVGKTSNSQTKLPNIKVIEVQEKNRKYQIYIIDCPGFWDSNGEQQDATNAYLVMTVFKYFKRARFLLCVPDYACFSGKSNEIFKPFQLFFKNFNVTTQNKEKIINATSLVVTKVNSLQTVQKLMKKFQRYINESAENNNFHNEKDLLKKFIKTKNIYLIPKVQKQFNKQFQELGKRIRQTQINLPKFQFNYQKDIKFQQSQSPFIKKMYKETCAKLRSSIEILTSSSYEIIKNMEKNIKEQKTYYFSTLIKKICQTKNQIYTTKLDKKLANLNNFEKIALNQIKIQDYEKSFVQIQFRRKTLLKNKQLKVDIQKIRQVQKQKQVQSSNRGNIQIIFQYAYRLFGRKVCTRSDNSSVSYLPLLSQYITSFANLIFNYGYPNQKQRQCFRQFASINSKYLLELEIIQNLCSSVEKNYLQLFDQIMLDEKKVNNSEKKYLLNCKIQQKPTLQYLKYFQKIIQQIDISDNQQDLMEQKKLNSTDLKFRRDQLNIQINWKRGIKLSQMKKNRQALQKCEIARRSYEQLYKQKNKERYIFVKKDFYERLGKMSMQLKYYDLAIQYFKVFQSQDSVKKCFQHKKAQNHNDIETVFNIYQDYAKYLASLTKFDQGTQILNKFLKLLDFSNEKHNEFDKKTKKLKNQFRSKNYKQKVQIRYQERYQQNITDYRPNQQLIAKLVKDSENDNKSNNILSQSTISQDSVSKNQNNRKKVKKNDNDSSSIKFEQSQ